MRSLLLVSLIGLLFPSLPSVASGQNKQTTEVQVEGHVYKPATLEPTEKRIDGLQVPDGFHIAKFAALSNTRMIAVADDGTVYVTQHEPGTLVMLRDTDRDGTPVRVKPFLSGFLSSRSRIARAVNSVLRGLRLAHRYWQGAGTGGV
jgi:hypothetical protein